MSNHPPEESTYPDSPLSDEQPEEDFEAMRERAKTQDGRALRRYVRRWKIERLFAWLLGYRRITTRWERHAENFLGFVLLGCACVLLRHF